MINIEENFKWHLEAFASELFIYRFSNSLPDLSQLLSEPKQTDELEEMTSILSTVFSTLLKKGGKGVH